MDKMLLTRNEAAKTLSISVDTLDELVKAGMIRRIKIGARVYFSPEELRAFITKEGILC